MKVNGVRNCSGRNRDRIDGLIVTLLNFGDQRAISIATLDLSEVLGRIQRMKDNDDAAQAKLAAIQKYVDSSNVPALIKIAKLGVVIDHWMAAAGVTISAAHCWTSLEENLGVVPCTVRSMMSHELLSSACETDICGVLAMHALQLASGTGPALLDGNNNHGEDPDKAVCFHCSNLLKHFFRLAKMGFQQIIAETVGEENAFGTCVGLIKPKPMIMSFARFSRDDTAGKMRGYVGEGRFTDDRLNTFGGAGVVQIPRMQKSLRYMCEKGFVLHIVANLSSVAAAVHEASIRCLGWDMY
jgi:L-fucose isomerase-like protein